MNKYTMYKVLIVDDEKYVRKSIIHRVNWDKLGLEIIAEAENGEAALQRMSEEVPDIVLTDIRMPLMDGLHFIKESKQRFSDVNYVLMTAYADFEYAQKAIQLGVSDYVLKPAEQENVENILRRIVHQKRENALSKLILYYTQTATPILLPKEKVLSVIFSLEKEEFRQKLQECIRKVIRKYNKEIDVYCLSGFPGKSICLLNGMDMGKVDISEIVSSVQKEFSQEIFLIIYSKEYDRKNTAQMILKLLELYGLKEESEGGVFFEEDSREDVIVEIQKYIQKNYKFNLNMTVIAEKFFLNSSYLSTLFKERTGKNMSVYIEEVRMEWAKHYLKLTDKSITEIALQVGYSNAAYFTKVFKKQTGMTPKEYREGK